MFFPPQVTTDFGYEFCFEAPNGSVKWYKVREQSDSEVIATSQNNYLKSPSSDNKSCKDVNHPWFLSSSRDRRIDWVESSSFCPCPSCMRFAHPFRARCKVISSRNAPWEASSKSRALCRKSHQCSLTKSWATGGPLRAIGLFCPNWGQAELQGS